MFDKAAFYKRVTAMNMTLDSVAKNIGVNYATLYRKMYGISDFTRSDIQQIIGLLGLTTREVLEIFFGSELAQTQETGEIDDTRNNLAEGVGIV